MGLVVGLLVLALLLGVVSLLFTALKWLLIIALALFAVGVVRGLLNGRRRTL